MLNVHRLSKPVCFRRHEAIRLAELPAEKSLSVGERGALAASVPN